MRQLTSCISLVFLITIGSKNLLASDYQSPRTMGLGGAGHAGPLLNDALYLNPSFISFLPAYSFSTNYQTYSAQPDPSGRIYNVAIQDGKSEYFQAGVSYSVRQDKNFIHLGLSRTFERRFGFGLGTKIITQPATANSNSLRTQELTFSTTLIATQWMYICLVADNLLSTATSKQMGISREIILGTKFNVMGIVLAYYDPHFVLNDTLNSKYGQELGLEFVILRDLFFRIGHYHESFQPHLNQYSNGVGLGLGWMGPKTSFDFGISRDFSSPKTASYSFGLTFFL